MTNGDFSEPVSYRETSRILATIDCVCKSRGCDRADLIREAVRFWLPSNSHLSSEEKKGLGVAQQQM
jgi:metal-responsive CopG/Arc/MetJ family transcriptional regulator